MDNKLTQINQKDFPILKNLYNPNDPKTYTGHSTVDTYIRWFQQNPHDTEKNDKIKFYCLNDDFSRGTFAITDDYTHTAYIDTLCDGTDELFKLLLLIDFSQGYFFYAINHLHVIALKQVLKQKNVEIIEELPCVVYHLPNEKALELDIQPPDGIELKPLNGTAIEKAFSVWPGRAYAPYQFFEQATKININVGAFKMDGSLVAWVLRWPAGFLAAVQTDENHYGRGYGLLVTKALSKQIAQLGCGDVYTSTMETNSASNPLYQKVGFKKLEAKKYWLCTKLNWSADK